MFRFEENARYSVRDLVYVSIDEMKASPEAVNIFLVFDDGEIPSSSRECILARYYWSMYHIFPTFKTFKKHHLYSHKRRMVPGLDAEILNTINNDEVDHCIDVGVEPPSLMTRNDKIYEITDALDELYRDLSHYALTLDAIGILDVLHHPKIAEVNRLVQEKEGVVTNLDIANANRTTLKLAGSEPDIRDTQLGKYFYYDCIKSKQFVKFITPIGYITDVDNFMIREPILTNLMSGMSSVQDILTESRTASMSITNQKGAIRDSEYLTRQVQLGGSSVFRVHKNTDCGSTAYHQGVIENKEDLKHYKGIYYIDPNDGVLKALKGDEYHLMSKDRMINFRTVIHCKLGDRYGFCSTCYGKTADMIFGTDNIGMQSASVIQEIMTQNLLSTKHNVESAIGEILSFSQNDQNYIYSKASDQWSFFLNSKLKAKDVSIAFLADEARRLPEIEHGMDLQNISPLRLSRLNEVVFRVYKDNVLVEEHPVTVSTVSQKAYFTANMLDYIRTIGWSVDKNGNYEVKLKDWDFTQQALGLPMVQFSTPAHMRAVKEMLTTQDTKGKATNSIMIHNTPGAALSAFQDLIRQKLSVNFVHLQVLISTYLTQDPENHDYRIPKIKSDGKLSSFRDIMTMRDFSLAMSFEKQYDTFKDIRSYIVENRPPHPHTNALRG